jgi:hypothetical protein
MVTLTDVQPTVCRRLAIPADLSLKQLHDVLQVAMGWTDSHLHQFEQDGALYGESDEFIERTSERRTRIGDLLRSPGDRLDYEYDFGDGWLHAIVVEDVSEAERRPPPRVLEATGACPPEDVGGPPGYEEFLAVMANHRHPEHAALREWYGGPFDSAAYDADAANARLARLRLTPPRVTTASTRALRRTPDLRDPPALQAPPETDLRFVRRLNKRAADPTTILTDREVAFLAAELDRLMHGFGSKPPMTATFAEDLVRWRAVQTMCERARGERGASVKDAAGALKIPQYRIKAVERGPCPEYRLAFAARYFRWLGLETWIGRWARANRELARRLGLG